MNALQPSGTDHSPRSSRRTFLTRSLYWLAGIASFVMLGRKITVPVSTASALPAELQPGVAELIGGTFLEHAAGLPDPSERASTLKMVLDGARSGVQGLLAEAEALMRAAVADDPQSRTAHAGLARVLQERYRTEGASNLIEEAVSEATTADRIGALNGQVRYGYYIGHTADQLPDRSLFDAYFDEILPEFESYTTLLGYGVGLRLLGDSLAEEVLRSAHELRPRGHSDPAVEVALFLLSQDRVQDALAAVSTPNIGDIEMRSDFVHLVRGVALERLGQVDAAREEYAVYAPKTVGRPVPPELLIEGSDAQRILLPVAGGACAHTGDEAIAKLARIITAEAGSESIGSMRAVGWTVRTRVFRGAPCCGGIQNGGDCVADKYWTVMTQSGQFPYWVEPPSNTARSQADATYLGLIPDPTSGQCVNGTTVSNRCEGYCDPPWYVDGAFQGGPVYFYGGVSSCQGSQFECAAVLGTTCSDGLFPNNCFSRDGPC